MNVDLFLIKKMSYFGIEGAIESIENDIKFLSKDFDKATNFEFIYDLFLDIKNCVIFLSLIHQKIITDFNKEQNGGDYDSENHQIK